MGFQRVLAFVAAGLCAASTASAEVQLSIANGKVSLSAKDATLRQILTEWARVGQTTIVNVDRIQGGPITLELTNMPEEQALELLLRSVSGFVAAPRRVAIANASRFDRVIVMATAPAPRAPTTAIPTPTQAPIFYQAPFPPAPGTAPGGDDSNDDSVIPVPQPNSRGPIFSPFPQPQVVSPQQAPSMTPGAIQQPDQPQDATSAAPKTAPGTVSAPGMIVPMPQPAQTPDQSDPRRQRNQ